jgi:hypothetical protein
VVDDDVAHHRALHQPHTEQRVGQHAFDAGADLGVA